MRSILVVLAVVMTSGLCQSAFAETALTGRWIKDLAQQPLLDPQTSGLTFRKGELIAVGDQSADESTRMKLFRLNPQTGQAITAPIPITVSDQLKTSCFYQYLSEKPDLEALTWDRIDDTTLITVTEDASNFSLTPECARKFAKTNSTLYPSLLVKIQVDPALTRAEIVALRPVQFPLEAKLGNFPNDGVEGLAVDSHLNLYLAVEQDIANKPRIFKTRLTSDFWARDNLVKVIDANLTMPPLDDADHPINGIEFIPSPLQGHPGYLAAVARNDDELWIFDLTNRVPPYVQKLSFYVSTDDSGLCQPYDKLVQTALESITYHDGMLYLVNDPWKQHYGDNIQCGTHADKFKSMSPLLFQLNLDPRWFSPLRSKVQNALPAVSGLASHDGVSYLAVQDKKIQRPGDRLISIQLAPNQPPVHQPLYVTNWPAGQMASDLEALCALPGRPGEYLAAESGTWQGAFGRLFHLKVFPSYAQVLGSYELPVERDNTPQSDGDNFEGLACASLAEQNYLLILGERGGAGQPGFLQWGQLNLASSTLSWNSQKLLVSGPTGVDSAVYPRKIADLYLQNDVLWASAVADNGDNGPFHSVIYPLALVNPSQPQPVNLMAQRPVFWRLDGLKIEAIAMPALSVEQAALMVGSDDENYQGVIRPLQKTSLSPYGTVK
ncbi:MULTISPECIES: hypothetical protein [Rheinheimera]|uniref:Phytase n=1 Tax=Rheinheimera marina TaxID=1774958 RepID=A0ABV9JQ12_9GAMM